MRDSLAVLTATAQIVASYLRKNPVLPSELESLIHEVHRALNAAPLAPGRSSTGGKAPPHAHTITGEHLICLEDGRKVRRLGRHLRTKHGMTPDQYRTKWDLPADYPMEAPLYSGSRVRRARSILRGSGLASGSLTKG